MNNTPTGARFVHLRAHSSFSLCEGAIPVKKLADMAFEYDQPAIAMTDNNNLFGALEFSKYCSGAGVQPIIGAIVTFYRLNEVGRAIRGDELVLLCQNEQGYKNLSKLVSSAHLDTPEHGVPMASLDQLAELNGGLIALWGGRGSLLFAEGGGAREVIRERANYLKRCFVGRLYLEIQRCGETGEYEAEKCARELALDLDLPLVATNDAYFMRRNGHLAQDILMCIGQGRYEIEENRPRLTEEHYLKSSDEMVALFSDLPEAIEATVEIARRCAFRVWFRKSILPLFPLPEGTTAEIELRKQAYAGFESRFETVRQRLGSEVAELQRSKYIERLEYELGVIEKTGFAGYFLIVSDFMIWTRKQGIPIGVRGSGATSIVAWCIYITQLDPVRFDLVFERFLNPERVSLPDFDVDFCQERRGEVIHYVRNKYGDDCVAQIVTFGKLQPKAAIKDVGRVVGAPFPLVDRMSKLIGDATCLDDAIGSEAELRRIYETDDVARRCVDLAKGVEGLYRHASTHAAGVIIANRPIVEYLPLYKDPNGDMPVTQFQYKDAEAVGLVKFDFLGLRTLTIIANAIDLIQSQRGERVDIENLPFDDQPVYQMLQAGDTTGVFQLESAGMKDLLKRMKPHAIDHLIALISLYRPGPMDSIPSYIARSSGQEPVTYDHPLTEKVLADTYGVITYQEHVMQIARDLAGYSLGEADLLRRAMGKKIASEMDKQWVRFSDGAEKKGVPKDSAKLIFEKCAKFAGYGFNKGHAAAYAQVSYQTAYLKHHYPLEFYAACMTVDSEAVERLNTYVQEAQGKGISMLPPDINRSLHVFVAETDGDRKAIRYSLAALKGVGANVVCQIVEERSRRGPFVSLVDVLERCSAIRVPYSTWERFTDAGAFDSLYRDRVMIRNHLKRLVRVADEVSQRTNSRQEGLFEGDGYAPQILPPCRATQLTAEDLEREKAVFGFYFSGHPISRIMHLIDRDHFKSIATLTKTETIRLGLHEVVCMVDAVQIRRSAKSGNKYAFVQISDPSGTIELLAFSELLETRQALLKVGAKVVARCNVEESEGGLRYMLAGLEDVTKVLAEAKKIYISISQWSDFDARIDELQKILFGARNGDMEMFIVITLSNGREVTIKLPEKVRISGPILDQLVNFGGINPIT